ncbi:MAG: endolytic transglycosylase MltG [Saprospiraceae bacterium]
MSNFFKKYKWVILTLFILGCVVVWVNIKPVFSHAIRPSEGQAYTLFVPTGSGFEEVFDILKKDSALINPDGFRKVARFMGYVKERVPSGKYILNEQMSTKTVIGKLRSGNQDPVNVVINNVRTIAELVGKIAGYLEIDSSSLLQEVMSTETQKKFNLTNENILSLFIPNTYQIFWNTSSKKLLERMKKEHDAFWNQERREKIKKLGLSPEQAYSLASIVEKETNYSLERPTIAGVYLNRLKQSMKLQADPTVVFALGQYELKRVLYGHLVYDSPYNTYMYHGIPPGPIYMPSISSLEAVINPEPHDYIFFCAKADNSGQHTFASTLPDHNKNARAFSDWLNKIGIK